MPIRCTKENVNYKIDCIKYSEDDKDGKEDNNADSNDSNGKANNNIEKEDKANMYLGETSGSAREQIHEHLWLFRYRKEACGEDCSKQQKQSSTNSALWIHSRDAHQGELRIEDWRVSITSIHREALNRQVTEAVSISNKGVDNFLNSKMEFGYF